jgi:endonuclease-3
MNPAKRREIFQRFSTANPHPKGELEYRSSFELLIAVILSAQATDKSVNLATRELYRDACTPQAIHALGVAGLEHYIKRIGLYRTKAKNIIATCKMLMDLHAGEVPQTAEALDGVVEAFRINWVWMPPWGPEKITEDGREQMRAIGFSI